MAGALPAGSGGWRWIAVERVSLALCALSDFFTDDTGGGWARR